MNSLIYHGRVAHSRYVPVDHALSYPLYFYGLDLGELPDLNRAWPLSGYNRTAVTAIKDKDYMNPGEASLGNKVRNMLAARGVSAPVARIFTITSARYFNYVFNPVSFHYCFGGAGTLVAVIAEVNNTYGERHPYVLTDNRAEEAPGWFAHYRTAKAFHVSPFNRIQGDYHFYFSEPGAHLDIRIVLVHENQKIMEARLTGKSRPLTPASQLKTMFKYPVTPHLSIPRIYTHAFRLFFQKKLPFNDKPVPRSTLTMKKQGPNPIEDLCMRLVAATLKRMNQGRLTLVLPDQTKRHFGPADGTTAVIGINDYNFFPRLVFDGEIGLGEAYMAWEWDSPDLVALLALLIKNRDRLSDGNLMLSFLTRIQEKLSHNQKKNTVKNAPSNIRAHYDLSNDFYRCFLDEWMLYSCAIFNSGADGLARAQEDKMQRILDQDRHPTGPPCP